VYTECSSFSVMRAAVALGIGVMAALVLVATALSVPPTLSSVGVQDRHPTATFSAPRSDFATIYLATKPGRATDGAFLSENIETLDLLTDAEIQAGHWVDDSQVDPGTYYVMLRASPDFDACWRDDLGGYDPACADGYSSVVPLTVPRPASRYVASTSVLRFLKRVELRLSAVPLGDRLPYRVCYRLVNKQRRCLVGTLDGFDWNSGATDTLSLNTRGLPRVTTFTWFVGNRVVAVKRARIPALPR
jgi:hypothetical protein